MTTSKSSIDSTSVFVAFFSHRRLVHAMPGAGKSFLMSTLPQDVRSTVVDTDDLLPTLMSKRELEIVKNFGPRPADIQISAAKAVTHILETTNHTVVTNFWSEEFIRNIPSKYLKKNILGWPGMPLSFQLSANAMQKRKAVPLETGNKWIESISNSNSRPASSILLADSEYLLDYLSFWKNA